MCVFLCTCVHVGGVCFGISASDEVLNYKAFRYVPLFATVLSGCLAFIADHEVTNHWMRWHGYVDYTNTHTHKHTDEPEEIVVSYTPMIRLWQLKSFHRLTQWPRSSVTNRLFHCQWTEAVKDLGRRSRIGEEWQEGKESIMWDAVRISVEFDFAHTHTHTHTHTCTHAHTQTQRIALLSFWFHLNLIPFIYLMLMCCYTVGRAKHTN